MNLYSHIVLAGKLEGQLRPSHPEDYYLGAAVPDIRYLCGWRRWQTHLPVDRIADFGKRHPHLESFVLGYCVHCLIDEFNPVEPLFQFPLNLVGRRLPKRFLPVLIEYYYLAHETARKQVSESGNEILQDLGIDAKTVVRFSTLVNTFLSAPSMEAWMTLAQNLEISNRPGIEQYLKAARIVRRNWLLRQLLLAGMNVERLESQLVQYVIARLADSTLGIAHLPWRDRRCQGRPFGARNDTSMTG